MYVLAKVPQIGFVPSAGVEPATLHLLGECIKLHYGATFQFCTGPFSKECFIKPPLTYKSFKHEKKHPTQGMNWFCAIKQSISFTLYY